MRLLVFLVPLAVLVAVVARLGGHRDFGLILIWALFGGFCYALFGPHQTELDRRFLILLFGPFAVLAGVVLTIVTLRRTKLRARADTSGDAR